MPPSRAERSTLVRVLIIILAVVLLAPLLMMVFMMPMMGMMGGWASSASSWGAGMSPMWSLGMILLLFVVLLGAGYLLYRTFTQESLSSNDPALEELRLAYARGDLTQEEFEQRREDLRQSE